MERPTRGPGARSGRCARGGLHRCAPPVSAHAVVRARAGRRLRGFGPPVGVLNVIVSSENGATDGLLADARLRKLTFTGSTDVGRHLIAKAADRVLRVSVELGGQAPFIVLADADLDAAVDGAVAAKMRNGAEACTAANRFSVDRAIADELTHRLAKRLGALRIGRGADASVDLGPMIGDRQRARLQGLVTDAVARGARIALEGGSLPGVGHFFAPVVLVDVPDDARVMREEIFGPIAPVIPVDGEADAVARANRCDQGLAGYVDTRDLDAAPRVSDALEVGMVPSTGGASPRLPRRLAARRSRDTGPLEARARWRTPSTRTSSR